MRVALFSDLHSNLPALLTCLEDAKSRGFDRVVILGDLVGYGPFPAEVTALCMRLQAEGAIVLRGNHDELGPAPAGALPSASAQSIAADWTCQQLEPAARQWLCELPLTHIADGIAFVHSTLDAPEKWRYAADHRTVEDSVCAAEKHYGARIVLCGHVHQQYLFYQGRGRQFMCFVPTPGVPIRVGSHRRWLATVGSVGQPRDGDPRANYAILDIAQGRLEFHRVAYDVGSVVAAIRRTGLPMELAARLEMGQ